MSPSLRIVHAGDVDENAVLAARRFEAMVKMFAGLRFGRECADCLPRAA